MSEVENTNAGIVPPAAPAAAAAVTPQHISALHEHLNHLGAMIKEGFEKVVAFVRKEAPAVEAGAAALGSAVPVLGPAVSVVEKVVGAAAQVVACVCKCEAAHGPNGCTGKDCSCPASSPAAAPAAH